MKPSPGVRPPARGAALCRAFALLNVLLSTGAAAATAAEATAGGVARDWKQHPAIVELDAPRDLYALGDVHGDYDRLVELLSAAKLLAAPPARPADARWAGGAAVLVCTGDLIDKYDHSLPVIELMRALEPRAKEAGGRLVVTLGNHEAEFLASGAEGKKGAEFAGELRAAGLSPAEVAAGRDGAGIGTWLRDLPAGARIGDWFFCHAGNTGGRRLDDLRDGLEKQIAAQGFAAPLLIDPDSMLEARMHPRPWWEAGAGPELRNADEGGKPKHAKGKPSTAGREDAVAAGSAGAAGEKRLRNGVEALGARHLVFGHQPGKVTFADGSVREPGEIFEKFDGLIFLIDTGMSRGVAGGRGALLWVRQGKGGGGPTVSAVYADGKTAALWPRGR